MPFQIRVIDTQAYESVARRLSAVADGSTDASLSLIQEARGRLGTRLRSLNSSYLIRRWESILQRPAVGHEAASRLAFPCLAILCVVDYQRIWPCFNEGGETAPKSDYLAVLGESQDPVLTVLLGPRSPFFHTFLLGFHDRAERWKIGTEWQLFSSAQVEQFLMAIAWASADVGSTSAEGSVCVAAAALAKRVLSMPGTSICLTAEE